MKKKYFSRALEWTTDVGLKAFAVLALVVGGIYVYAEVVWPTTAPNATTGVVGMFVGESKNPFNTVDTYYDGVNDYCSEYPENPDVDGSHVCTPDEMINSYNHANTNSPIITYYPGTAGSSAMLWINNGPPGYTANSNDCNGWTTPTIGTDSQNPNYGAVWNFRTKAGGLVPCKTGKKFACCK